MSGQRLKKKVKPGRIELDPVEPTIVVYFDTLVVDEASIGMSHFLFTMFDLFMCECVVCAILPPSPSFQR